MKARIEAMLERVLSRALNDEENRAHIAGLWGGAMALVQLIAALGLGGFLALALLVSCMFTARHTATVWAYRCRRVRDWQYRERTIDWPPD
jgi:hypothetical protein